MISRSLAVMTAAASLAIGAADPVRAETALHPTVSSSPARLTATVNFADLARSFDNERALHAMASAKSVIASPVRLPNGKPAGSVLPKLSTVPRLATNTILATSGIAGVSGFTGIYEGENSAVNGSELEPPDQGMTVANNVVGEIVNNTIQFFRGGQPLTAPVANSVFFGSGSIANLSDPHITYDPSVERWFVDELTYSGPLGYGFYLAVSKTSDPTGAYDVFFVPSATSDIPACGKAGCLPDYPQVGYDAFAFYITADLFPANGYAGAAIYVFPKASLVTGQSFNSVRFVVPEYVVQPTVPAPGEPFVLTNNGTEYFMTSRLDYNQSDTLRVYEVRNSGNIITAPATLKVVRTTLHPARYAEVVPATEPDVIGPFGKSQHATQAPMLNADFDSFSANIKLASGKLYGTISSSAVDGNGLPRDIVTWYEVDVSGTAPVLTSQGNIVPPDGYSLLYPDLALDRRGKGYIGASICNPDKKLAGGFPSTAIIPFERGTIGSIVVTGQGATSDDGFTGYPPNGTVGRWGDYGSAVIDPITGIFYTANEFIPNPAVYPRGVFANWGTYITAIKN